ncbi:hypothetical protein KQX54_001869 [Cotesia glomerata]|uniref:Uncharacterized protein n=1 Tax=Cotesia glomerata TaxID=32391 RepID=A0AAV7IQ40_COTGL|nr:hypothetical protein KQX54_001869 [Cotesia glomerata]
MILPSHHEPRANWETVLFLTLCKKRVVKLVETDSEQGNIPCEKSYAMPCGRCCRFVFDHLQATTSKGQDNKNRKSSPVTFQHPLGNSTPLSHISDSETDDDRPSQHARTGSLPQIPGEFSSDSSLPPEQVENFENPNSLAHSITNELFIRIYIEKNLTF